MGRLRVSIKIIQSVIFAILLTGCTHSVEPAKPLQRKSVTQSNPESFAWHDGSKGGEYGIGEGWSIKLLPAEYETIFDVVTLGYPGETRIIPTPTEYEWMKDESADLSEAPIMVSKLFTIPAEYMTVTETIVVQPEHTGYFVTDATYNADGSINTPKTVKPRVMPAILKQEERHVVKTPARTIERMVPLERRKGYRRVVKTPAGVIEEPRFIGPYYRPKKAVAQPWRFLVKNSGGAIVHVFDDFDDLKTFVDRLK